MSLLEPGKRALARIIPDALFPSSSDELRHARLVVLFALITAAVGVPLSVVQLLYGAPQVLAVAVSVTVGCAAVVVLTRLTRSVPVGANALVAVYALGFTAVTVLRGGFGQPIVMGFALVPMMALPLAGRVAGAAWLVLTLVILGTVALVQRHVGLPRAPLVDALATNWPGHMLFVGGCYVLMAVHVGLRQRAMQDERAAREQLWESERRRLASENEAQLLRSSRMAELGTLAAGVAHEINNPLTYINNNLEYLQLARDQLSPADLDEILEETRLGAARIARIVRDISTFSRVDPDESDAARVDVHEVLETSLALVRNELHHRARLVRELGPVPAVAGNASRLAQVFVNVLTNAVQALPEGGTAAERITLRTREGQGPRGGRAAVVEIEDSGAGMAPEARGRAFEPFFTTKPVGVGTGLGLSICYGIVTKLGGQIVLEAGAGGRGTRVRIVLPAAPDGVVVERPAQVEPLGIPQEAPARDAALRVLIVDDNAIVARSVARMLSHHDVTIETQAGRALELLSDGDPYDAVLCDLMMPEMDGMELQRQLQARNPRAVSRLIFVTGGAFTPRAHEFVRTTRHPVLDKPLDPDTLEAALQRVQGAPEEPRGR